jgi:hypothetical protein
MLCIPILFQLEDEVLKMMDGEDDVLFVVR